MFWFTSKHYRGKLRVLLVEGGKETPIAFEVTNITEAAIGAIAPNVPTNPKPETEPFTWERLMCHHLSSNRTIRESLERWGTIIEDDWYKYIDGALNKNRFQNGVQDTRLKLEHWKAYQFTVGTIGYIRVIVE